ncbi:MAG: NAD(P)/FAD-dependent oxidoreductase [Candidatus Thermoplasmatota archaeon]|nr:NAD(P)/FAD-dependent oxidoreductase [Candidatus Thermoplasmatota archaeon]
MSKNEYEVVIIGGGPAGLSAAIYTARAELKTLILDEADKLLEKAEKIDNYFGFPKGVSGKELLRRGADQAKRFGAEIIEEKALLTKINSTGEGYVVETTDKRFKSKGLIISPGIQHKKPPIEGMKDFEGKGVSYCVVCDAPLYKGKKVGLLGSEDLVGKEALELFEYTEDIKIYTNGEELDMPKILSDRLNDRDVPVEKGEIEEVVGDEEFRGLRIEGEVQEMDGLMIAEGSSGSLDFARSLGITIEDGVLSVDDNMFTGVPKVYAAGDCVGGARQISAAVGEGAKAALGLINDLREQNYKDWSS